MLWLREDPRPETCIEFCTDRVEEFVYALQHEDALTQLEAGSRCGATAAVGVGLRCAAARGAEESNRVGGGRRQSDSAIARGLAVNRKTVTLWRERFVEQGLDSMWEVAPGRGRKRAMGDAKWRRSWRRRCTASRKG